MVKRSPEFVASYPGVPLGPMIGMRNRVAHGYDDIDFEVVWDTVRQSIPDLLAKLPVA